MLIMEGQCFHLLLHQNTLFIPGLNERQLIYTRRKVNNFRTRNEMRQIKSKLLTQKTN